VTSPKISALRKVSGYIILEVVVLIIILNITIYMMVYRHHIIHILLY
jgi:hypothetical protein